MIARPHDLKAVRALLRQFPTVAILGARQCGKTTLAQQIPHKHFFDLENPRDAARLAQPQLALEKLTGTIVIDEVQRMPELFPLLRHLVDTRPHQKYLILGSASRDLIRHSSESLAGRIGHYHLGGFTPEEVGFEHTDKLWLRGGYPRSFLASSNTVSHTWRENYITTFLERDIPQLGIAIPAHTLRRFWMMLSHYHGQVINYSDLGRSMGVTDTTIKHYLDILVGTFMVRLLPPWFVNTGKRQVKSPKIYLRDSGIFHTLQSITSSDELQAHPKLGASWEGFVIETAAAQLAPKISSLFFWGTHGGAELDLYWQSGGKSYGLECKYQDAPRREKSQASAIQDLHLEHLWVVYPGDKSYPIDSRITALPLKDIAAIAQ